jgi:ribonucleoside-diphosphate reductase alpha chain
MVSKGLVRGTPIVRLASRMTTVKASSRAAASEDGAKIDVSARYVDSTLTHGANALTLGEHPVEMREPRTNGVAAVAPMSKSDLFKQRATEAKLRGYVGVACTECFNFTMVRNGTCLKCDTCGATSGCS